MLERLERPLNPVIDELSGAFQSWIELGQKTPSLERDARRGGLDLGGQGVVGRLVGERGNEASDQSVDTRRGDGIRPVEVI